MHKWKSAQNKRRTKLGTVFLKTKNIYLMHIHTSLRKDWKETQQNAYTYKYSQLIFNKDASNLTEEERSLFKK